MAKFRLLKSAVLGEVATAPANPAVCGPDSGSWFAIFPPAAVCSPVVGLLTICVFGEACGLRSSRGTASVPALA